MAPKDLTKGVMLVGVRAISKADAAKQRKECQVNKSLVNRYRQALATGKAFTSEGEEGEVIDACLSLYDPEMNTPEGAKEQWLGANTTHYFYRIPLIAFDNGFKKVPEDLEGEIAEIYKSFQTW